MADASEPASLPPFFTPVAPAQTLFPLVRLNTSLLDLPELHWTSAYRAPSRYFPTTYPAVYSKLDNPGLFRGSCREHIKLLVSDVIRKILTKVMLKSIEG